ncbi:hypothetical protein QYM36_009669 [Artemia franciscana]|uniref:Uncharacterized protein n=1 Tax=Artemia franciscana TaxID=6661 RepID=A0AA88HTL0_ARTSF|nr:hypothetical protein QYM36_009669 [Artemia franciscana]
MDMARKATHKYQEGAIANDSPEKKMYRVDLQKVTLIPELPGNKDSVFLSRLIVFIETFAKVYPKDPGSLGSGNSFCMLWNEALRGRGAESIVDSLLSVITATSERDINSFIFWMDHCSGQKKNWTLTRHQGAFLRNKKEVIVKKLCPMMPCNSRQFWLDLPVTAVPDLTIDEDYPYEEE